MQPQEYEVELLSLDHLDAQTVKARFAKPAGFDFLPGQFVMIGLEGSDVKRAYSIASGPSDDFIELCVKVHPDGKFSGPLVEFGKEKRYVIKGPYGKFTLDMPVLNDTLFVAAGTGIAPIISMIRAALADGCEKELVLAFGIRKMENFLYADEIKALEQKYPNFTYRLTLSQPEADWEGDEGYVQDLVERHYSDGADKHAYLCGPPAMVKDLFESLKAKGYTPHREMW